LVFHNTAIKVDIVFFKRDKMKTQVKKVYRRCVQRGSSNLSGVDIPSGKKLAKEFGYPSDLLKEIPASHWKTFAGCGNPWLHVKMRPKWRVLDLGCGTGIDTAVASKSLDKTGFVVGIDLVFEMVKASSALFNSYLCSERGKVSFLGAEGEYLPFKSHVFDLVVSNGVLSLLPDKRVALEDVYRVLKDGGRVIICDLVRLCPLPEYFYDLGDSWAWCMLGAPTKLELKDLLKNAGFSTIRFTWGKTFHYFATATAIGFK